MAAGLLDMNASALTERRTFAGSMAFSVVFHILFFAFIGLLARSGSDALQVSRGIPVELIEYVPPATEVKAPAEGVQETQGEIRLPRHRERPEAKPRTLRSRERRPRTSAPKPEKPAGVAAATPPDPQEGAGGRMETEVPFPFDYYTQTITRLIMGHWAPVAGVADSTRCVVGFQIGRDGGASGLELREPSGDRLFDGGAMAAVQSVGKFPPLPQGFQWDRLKVRFHFEYRRGY